MADRSARPAAMVFASALLLRLLTVVWAHGRIPPAADGSYYQRLAERIASGHGYTWLWPDGAVTYAAHYPVGYPALLGFPYAVWGASPTIAMLVNALVGALGCLAIERLVAAHAGRRTALVAGMMAALHPGLIAYTPALMTEGVTASLLACAAWATSVARQSKHRRGFPMAVAAGLLGVATLVRPQCVVLAPLVGWLAVGWQQRGLRCVLPAALTTVMTVAVVLPWTARNCVRMDQCALVSVNGGWNLLIGTQAAGEGGWSPLEVPDACREVFDEADKDQCFGHAARGVIASDPVAWLSLAPAKLAVTMDYCGAAGWYLHEANPEAVSARFKLVLGTVETVYERLLLLLALLAAWAGGPPRRTRFRWLRRVLLGVGLAAAVWTHATLAWVALVALASWRDWRRCRPMYLWLAASVASVMLLHALFFGAGRYQLVLWLLMCSVAALGWTGARRLLASAWSRSSMRR